MSAISGCEMKSKKAATPLYSSGFYKSNPGTDVGLNQMIRKVTDKSRGIRLGNYVQVRDIEDEELEQVWAGKKTAKEALDAIVQRGNEQLERFEKANKGR